MPKPVSKPHPEPQGQPRKREAFDRRVLAAQVARDRPPMGPGGSGSLTATNNEEIEFCDTFASNFTKGLPHNLFGIVDPSAYDSFVTGINQAQDRANPADPSFFDTDVPSGTGAGGNNVAQFNCRISEGAVPGVRSWESPRAGHAYDLEGADADRLCMPPAPRIDSAELAVEMAEVYAMALLRDTHFKDISAGTLATPSGLTAAELANMIDGMDWFDQSGGNAAESARRSARDLVNPDDPTITSQNLFRGSSKGCEVGPYVSQFMLIGTPNRSHEMALGIEEGQIQYGSQTINQMHEVHRPGIDYMTDWSSWLDVQLGAGFAGQDLYDDTAYRFIGTPRDLATYVHFDQLYQAYLNAALIMTGPSLPGGKNTLELELEEGFPSGASMSMRGSFATFGGPHLLGILTEVSTRALRAVRRQKFNYHRRCRPEVVGGRLTLVELGHGAELGNAQQAFTDLRDAIPLGLRQAIKAHNIAQNDQANMNVAGARKVTCANPHSLPSANSEQNYLLLPMAFPEGSPMHPAYGAGHATVAGACVTVLKAFFQLHEAGNWNEIPWPHTLKQANATRDALEDADASNVTVEGELNKLAANISIGRNMAGVHYYSDYYDSLRLGERVTVSILQEQMTNYPEHVEMRFRSFDGNAVIIRGRGGSNDAPQVVVHEPNGKPGAELMGQDYIDWWNCVPPQRTS
ncbi:MAG: vanadium-dependent haloperoxidase [Hyphomicrobiaceae bacterium]